MSKYQEYKLAGLCRRCGADPLPGKTRCEQCHVAHLEYGRRFKEKAIASSLCRHCCTNPKLENCSLCEQCRQKHQVKESRRYAKMRADCVTAYGGECVCCGEDNPKYLQLDHVDNDGAEHRRQLAKNKNGRGGGSLYAWAVRNKFPKRLQLLCCNCHQAKTLFGGCTPEDHPIRSHSHVQEIPPNATSALVPR